mmetsp:Transcript_40109/g.74784  ORF Transcript_40109/g.74784 Transcript_40109/m.74784 type:complete len:285 (-) Transcript_40109:128-982(-)
MAMFQVPTRPAGHVHVEFKAGRMDWDGRMVTADKRKGKILLYTSEEDQLTHFQWMDREKNDVVTDLIVINDAYLERIQKCTTGRAYIMRFTSSDKKMFFWMQEPSEEKDEENVKKFNEAIGATIPDKKAGGATAVVTPAAPSVAAPAAAPAGDIDPQLRAVLTQFLNQQGGGAQAPQRHPLPLTAVLTTEVLQSLLTDEQACSEMQGLLPDTHKSQDGLREVLASPQLQQSLSSLTQAVHSDQLPVLLSSLGLSPSVISSAQPGSDALELLCRAMEAQFKGTGS